MTTAALAPRIAPLPRTYAVDSAPGGKFVIRRVPIFAEHERTFAGGHPVTVTLGWLKTCALNMREDEARDGYAAPVHLGHHDPISKPFDDRPGVGALRAPVIARAIFKGKPTWVLFADVEARDRAALDAIKAHPYRSVEADVLGDRPRIRGLALMQGQAPYFTFPLLELDESRLDRVAYAAGDGRRLVLGWAEPLRLTENGMDPTKDEINADAAPEGEVVESVENEAAEGEAMARIEAKLDGLAAALDKLAAVFQPALGSPAGDVQASATKPVMAASATAPAPALKVLASKKAAAAKPAPKADVKPKTDPGVLALATAYAESVKSATAPKAEAEVIAAAEKKLADRPTPDVERLRSTLSAAYKADGERGVALAVETLRGILPSLPSAGSHRDAAPARTTVPPEVAVYADTPAYAHALALYQGWQRRPAAFASKPLSAWLANDPQLAAYAPQVK